MLLFILDLKCIITGMAGDELSPEAKKLGIDGEEVFYTECPDTGELIEYRYPTFAWIKPEEIYFLPGQNRFVSKSDLDKRLDSQVPAEPPKFEHREIGGLIFIEEPVQLLTEDK